MAEIKYTKNVLWLKPFVESAKDLVPLERLYGIKGYKVSKHLEETTYGSLTQYGREKRLHMAIRIMEIKKKPKTKRKEHKKGRCETILLTLAHELAHLVHWEHVPEHFELQGRLVVKFYSVLKKSGIKDFMTRHPDKYFKENI